MRALGVLGLWAAAAIGAGIVAPPIDGWLSPHPAAAFAAGLVVGVALFGALARQAPTRQVGSLRRALARTFVLVIRSAYEEAAWRGIVLGLLLPLGRGAALVVSTALFATAHARRLGRHAAWHLCTGSSFASLYLATGTLLAPIAAHAAYNVTVGLALLAEDRPFRTIDVGE
jgi:membrane protease YdiL (CAAX protease family)